VEELPQVTDSLVIHLDDAEGAGELLLFVVMAPGSTLDDDLRREIARRLRAQLSPRHVPDRVSAVSAIPRTHSGKKLEVPVKRILLGESADAVASRGALGDPTALDDFVRLAQRPRADGPTKGGHDASTAGG
jgi:acetoacetyl-CoA synthetase